MKHYADASNGQHLVSLKRKTLGENQSPFIEISYKAITEFLQTHDEAIETAERAEYVRLSEKFKESTA